MNRSLLIILILVVFIGCKSEETRTVNIPQLGWSINLPLTFHFADSAFDQQGHIRDSLWEREKGNKPRIELFWLRADPANYCNAIVYEDSTDLAAWEKKTTADSRFYFSIIAGAPDTRVMDSSISVEKLDNAEFQKEYINYRKKRNDMAWSYQFSRRYKQYAIYINVRYTDKRIGKKYLKMIENAEYEE